MNQHLLNQTVILFNLKKIVEELVKYVPKTSPLQDSACMMYNQMAHV